MTTAIDVENVGKTYRTKIGLPGFYGALSNLVSPKYADIVALEELSFTLEFGKCLGFLGGNGAGKSTLTKILTGVQKPTVGAVKLLGKNPTVRSHDLLRQIGVVFGHKSSLWWDLPVRESLTDVKFMYGLKQCRFDYNLERLVAGLNLSSILGRPVRELSLGERVKAELAAQLVHDPLVLFLDEPTVGLDIQSKAYLRTVLNDWKIENNMAIFLTSHDSTDIDACCDQIMIVHAGRSDFYGTADSLRTKFGVSQGDSSNFERQLLSHFRMLDRQKNE